MLMSMSILSDELNYDLASQDGDARLFITCVADTEYYTEYLNRLSQLTGDLRTLCGYWDADCYNQFRMANLDVAALLGMVEVPTGLSGAYVSETLTEVRKTVFATGDVNVSLTSLSFDDDYEIFGDMSIDNEVVIGSHSILVAGSVDQTGGNLLAEGSLHILGDYTLTGNSVLSMTTPNAVVDVDGSFTTESRNSHNGKLTGGTMYIGGDFTETAPYNGDNFKATESHTTVLDGTQPQSVSFASGNSCFNNLLLMQDYDRDYTFNRKPCWNDLELHTEVYGVSLTAPRDDIALGYYILLNWYVNGVNISDTPLYWMIIGSTSADTTVSDNGILTVGADETAAELTVVAVSADDGSQSASVTLTVLEEYPLVTGDLNGDGVIDVMDATTLQRHLAGIELIDARRLPYADADGDGSITVADVTQLQAYAAGMVGSLG